jgi:glycosyltransferase involved in cell wall biosynthesis
MSMSLVDRVVRAGLPAVGMVCDPWMVEGPRRDPWARRSGPPSFAGVRWLFVSRALRDRVRAAGVDVGDAEVVPWGVDLEALPLAPERPVGRRVLYAGRLSRLKGVDLAVRALAGLPGTTLEVVGAGDPDYVRELRELAEELCVAPRVVFAGARSRPEVAAAYARADAVLFPVRWEEPFGAVPLEAMARGTPVVATATGGSAEFLLPDRTALVVPPEDPAAIAAAVRRLEDDRALHASLREAGRRMAERYPAGRSHATVLRALEEVAATARRKADSRPA